MHIIKNNDFLYFIFYSSLLMSKSNIGGVGMFKSPHILPPYIAIYPYTKRLFLPNFFHRIPITAIKHTDFGIDGILINVRNHTINGIISLHKFFLPNRFFPTSFSFTDYIIHYTKYHSCNQ